MTSIMNKILSLSILCLLFIGIGFTSCSDDDDNTSKYFGNMTEMFQNMKGNYSGNLTMPDNTVRTQRFSIADNTVNGTTNTNVVVTNFPLDAILSRLYPNDYQYVTNLKTDTYAAPIDSVGFPGPNIMNFKTDADFTEQLNFSFEHNGESHTGWAQIMTTGLYYGNTGLLHISFSVTDLAIDNNDQTSLLPINYEMDAEKREE